MKAEAASPLTRTRTGDAEGDHVMNTHHAAGPQHAGQYLSSRRSASYCDAYARRPRRGVRAANHSLTSPAWSLGAFVAARPAMLASV